LSGGEALRRYERGWLRYDVLAGLTVAAYFVPQVMAYAQLAGLPAVAGLWVALGPLVVYFLLGSSRLLSLGPESTTALLTATAIGPLAAGDPARYAALAAVLALMVGVICVVGWAARLGFLADLLSKPVLVGYLTGIALIMITGQLGRVTGASVSGDSPPAEVVSAIRLIGQWKLAAVLLSITALVLLFALARWTPRLPGPLVVVALAAVVTWAAQLGDRGVALVAALTIVATLLFAGPLLETFPIPALGALVVYAAVRLIDVGEFRRIASFRRSELLLALATTVGVVAFDVLYGVLVAVALSVIDVLRRVARPHDGILGYVPGIAGMHDVDDYPDARPIPGLVVYRYDSPLFFANAEDFHRRALAAVDDATTPAQWLLLNTEANVGIDITAIDALDALREELMSRGIVLALARVKQELRDDLQAAGFLDRLGPDRVFYTLPTAVEAFQRAASTATD
jgi:MFS superfamily sulfate permease-like transporter